MKKPIDQRREVMQSLLSGEITVGKAAELLSCSRRSIERYRKAFFVSGAEGLRDHRRSNYHKLTAADSKLIVTWKEKDRWRSARNIRDKLNLPVRTTYPAHLTKSRTHQRKSQAC